MNRGSEITFAELTDSPFGRFVKVVYNGRTIYNDADDGLYIEGKLVKLLKKNYFDGYNHSYEFAIKKFKEKYGEKRIYTLYCRVVDFHHTELYIEGE